MRIGLALVLFLTLTACSEDAPPRPAPELASLLIGPGRVGPLHIGMDHDDAVRTGMVKTGDDDGCSDWIVSTYPRETIYYEFCRGDDDDLDGILIKVAGPHTREGIEVGARRSKVEKTYGDRLVKAPAQFVEGTLVLEDEKGDVRFNFDGGKVFTIDVTRHRTPTFDGSG
jgi:hypothetical protein